MRKFLFRPILSTLCIVAIATLCASCGNTARQGRGSSYLIIDKLEGASGADKTAVFAGVLQSDVLTDVKLADGTIVPTVFEDFGRVALRVAMKDVTTGTSPTTNNQITITSYHVTFVRSDGRNGQGVDVPYAFDGAITGTVGDPVALNFVIVRAQAKLEAPLAALAGGGTISTIAQITFYGRDQAGNDVSVSGQMSVNFANWGDPQ